MLRPNLLQALLASTAWFFGAPKAKASQLDVVVNPEPDGPPLQPVVDSEQFVVVTGGVLPGNGTTRFAPSNTDAYVGEDALKNSSHLARPSPGQATYYKIPVEDHPAGVWPHLKKFAVSHEVQVGTVDQLVELYREKLVVATRRMKASGIGIFGQEQWDAEQERLREVNPSPAAIVLPFDQGRLQAVMELRETMRQCMRTGWHDDAAVAGDLRPGE